MTAFVFWSGRIFHRKIYLLFLIYSGNFDSRHNLVTNFEPAFLMLTTRKLERKKMKQNFSDYEQHTVQDGAP